MTVKKFCQTAAFLSGAIALLVLVFIAVHPSHLDAFRRMSISRDRSEEIAGAIVKCSAEGKALPDFKKPGWGLSLSPFMDAETKRHLSKEGAIVDAKGNPYEISRTENGIEIFSLAMRAPLHIEMTSGKSAISSTSRWQSFRLFFYDLFY